MNFKNSYSDPSQYCISPNRYKSQLKDLSNNTSTSSTKVYKKIPEEETCYTNAPSPFKDPTASEEIRISRWEKVEIALTITNLTDNIPDEMLEEIFLACGFSLGWSRGHDRSKFFHFLFSNFF